MHERGKRISLIAFVIVATIAAWALAEEKKETAAAACTACHPAADSTHRRSFESWQTSAHSKSLSVLSQNPAATADCFGCHSSEGFKAKLKGKKVDIAQKESFSPVTCVTCHNPHESKEPHHLVTDPETLCTSCHTQRAVLQGVAFKGIEEARSYHSAVDCFSCHMTASNHSMKLVRPDDANVPENRMDTCTGCHKDNNRKARAEQIRGWQESYRKEMDPLQQEVKLIEAALKENPGGLNAEMKAKWQDVKYNLSILVKDRSSGTHNADLSATVLSAAAKDLAEIRKILSLKK